MNDPSPTPWINAQTLTNTFFGAILVSLLGCVKSVFGLFDRVKSLEGRIDATATKADFEALSTRLDSQDSALQELKAMQKSTHDVAVGTDASVRTALDLLRRK